MTNSDTSTPDYVNVLRRDLYRMARFGANISDAHSCLIFLPAGVLDQNRDDRVLDLVGIHSLSTDTSRECQLSCESGLIGWVARHRRTIHVSPFEYDSRTLGVYSSDKQLKSFIGIPIILQGRENVAGVIACDSKKSFAFSKLQGKLLEDLAGEVSNTVKLLHSAFLRSAQDPSWQGFMRRVHDLINALGPESIDVLRIRARNFELLERKLGTAAAVQLAEQVLRLMQQSLPPHFPLFRLPGGDLILILDNMMTKFYENKFEALSAHVQAQGQQLQFDFYNSPPSKAGKRRVIDIEQLIRETCHQRESIGSAQGSESELEQCYEFRRA